MSMTENWSLPKSGSNNTYEDGSEELRRGPWTVEEDNLLVRYITSHGEGRWNSLAKFAGLKRTGKSCRLRWLNYLKPDVKRGNLSPHEQLLILELHSEWGNRWSRIAQQLPGRTDNEIKNYWRTRVQKQARQLKVDSNSEKFLEAVRRFWMPRLLEKMRQNSSEDSSPSSSISTAETQRFPLPSPTFNQPNMSPKPSNYMVNSISDYDISFGNSTNGQISRESFVNDHSFYQSEIPCYDIYSSGCHVADNYWFEDGFGSTSWATYAGTDELWQFGKQGV